MEELKKGEYIDHIKREGDQVFVYLVLEDGDFVGLLERKEK